MIERTPGDSEIVAALSGMANALYSRNNALALRHAEDALELARSFNRPYTIVAEACVESCGGTATQDVARPFGHAPVCACSFCGAPDGGDGRLIAGPAVFICVACLDTCVVPLPAQNGVPARDDARSEVATAPGKGSCSFCGRPPHEVTIILAAHGYFICSTCVPLCRR